MKKQSGFTLIELLLVLAIIGIISAIAIPALLSQRARARDKSATQNAVSKVGDIVGQWDKGREAQLTASTIIANLGSYLTQTTANEKNPWAGTGATPSSAYAQALIPLTGQTTASGFDAALQAKAKAANLGQVQLGYQIPTASGSPGFFGAAVYLQGAVIKSKVSSLE